MFRLRQVAAFGAALALVLAGCGTGTSGREAGAPPTATAQTPMLDPAVEKRLLAHAAQRLADAADRLNPQDGYPRSTGPDGRWQLADADNWTSGFFAGSLWLMDEQTGDPVWRQTGRTLDGRAGVAKDPHRHPRPRLHDLRQLRPAIPAHQRPARP